MRELLIDCAELRSNDDFYDSFFRAVGAPAWHGRNFDALNDSIGTGQINAIEVPYRVVIRNRSQIPQAASEIVSNFISLLEELASKGCPVEVRLE